MSNEAKNYVRRLHLSGRGSTGRGSPHVKYVASEIADRAADDASGIKSWAISTGALADETHISERHIRDYLDILVEHGLVSVLDRFDSRGRQTSGRFVVHGPWDLFGGTGIPFPEVVYSKGRPRLDETHPIEVTSQRWAELEQRFSAMAQDYGTLPSGTARARWRIGCRAHGITTWWGVGRTVLHGDRAAMVLAARDRDGRTSIAPQVCLRYRDGTESSWVAVTNLTQPSEENTSSYRGDSFDTPSTGGDDTSDTPGDDTSDTPRSSSQHPLHPPQAPRPRSPQGEPHQTQEEEEEESAGGKGVPLLVSVIQGVTDASEEEAVALVERCRGEATKSLSGYVRRLCATGDMEHRLYLLRREEARKQAPQPRRAEVVCSEHGQTLPCRACRSDVTKAGDRTLAQSLLALQGPEVRWDLVELLGESTVEIGGVR